MIVSEIINPIRNHNPIGQTRKIMIKGQYRFLRVQATLTIKAANQFFFFVSILMTGFPSDKYCSLSLAIF